jgi:hypothetical protein
VICQNQIQKSSANRKNAREEGKFVELKEMPKSENCKYDSTLYIKPGYGLEGDPYEHNQGRGMQSGIDKKLMQIIDDKEREDLVHKAIHIPSS